jgi:type IV pilus assembly protein PilY1
VNTTSRNAVIARPARMSRLAPVLACIVTVLGLPVHAAVSLPDTPMQTNNGVPPNIWFILDDSGSMASTFMPDTVPATAPAPNIAQEAYTRNSIHYNPNNTYRGWQRADGTFMNDTPYTAVFTSTTLASGGTTNLSGSTLTFYVPTATNTDLADTRQYTRYQLRNDGTATACTWRFIAPVGFNTCNVVTSFTWGSVTRNLAQEKANYANWYSYHRTRTKVAKAGASYAFNDPSVFNDDSDYRVGFTTIWQRNEFRIPVTNNGGLFKGNNPGENRRVWFDRLFDATANGFTPLIPALGRAGAYFEETGATGPWGPQATASQFECRQNFTILTTDGYWNDRTGAPTPGNSDNTNGAAITRPDGPPYTYTAARPYMDNWSDTLADVAMHYWKRDLRPGLINTVPASASNPAFWQHMVTFGISIGLKGTLDPKTDLPALTSGTKVWPNPMDAEDLDRIDDLFHASVNGRGAFVAAGNPEEFADGLGNALRAIAARRGSGSNATVTGTSTSAGTKVFQAKFFSSKWYGEVQAYPVSGTGVDVANPIWTATVPVLAARSIYTHNGTAGTTFPTAAQNTALTPAVANYIRGDRTQEPQFNATGVMRDRNTLLGDIVNSSPTYVKTSTTVDTVYVGANDGMLHAFNATDGVERFAYVPRGIDLAKLKTYSEPDYGHHFFVDGPIITSTSRELANRTVLVGSLGRGGRGLYALDVTDPTIFGPAKVLWDKDSSFDGDMGQVLSRPIIAKLNDGSTGLIVSNGVNSTSERAVLFVLDLVTGAKIAEIDTGVGSPVTSNGLAAPRGWDDDGDGTVDIVYAGDLRGNLWKFDLSNSNPSQWKVADNRPIYAPLVAGTQPVTGGVTIAIDPATDKRWVFFGTGRLLSTGDITDTSRQTWYGVIDEVGATSSVTRTSMTARNIAQYDAGTRNRAFEPNSPLPVGSKGWYIDLDLPPGNTLEGERMVGDQQVVKNALIAGSIIPSTSNPCLPGRGYINAIDAFTGTSLLTGLFDANRDGEFGNDTMGPGNTAVGSIDLGVGMVTDPALLDRLLVAGGSLATLASTPLDPALYGGRISWREIIRR